LAADERLLCIPNRESRLHQALQRFDPLGQPSGFLAIFSYCSL
jgi:hypothetical protein